MKTQTKSRPRNAAATRAAILDAARRQFLRDSYDNVGVRDIAAAADVDPALVYRYAGSKEELFAQVLDCTGDPSELFEGSREDFGERIAAMLVHEPKNNAKLEGMLIMLRSANSQKAAELVQESIGRRFHNPFTEWLGGEDADIRARLIGGIMMGMSLSRTLTDGYGLSEEKKTRLCRRLAALIQEAVEG